MGWERLGNGPDILAGDAVDGVDALGLQLGVLLDVGREVVDGAGRRER